MKISTREFRDKYLIDNDPKKFSQLQSMVNITGGKMSPFPGGIVLLSG